MSDAPFDTKSLVAAYETHNQSLNHGKGQSESGDSGALGWGESGILDGFVKLYEATEDRVWLDRIVKHFDRMLSSRADAFGDGHPTWATSTYSVGLIRTGRLHNRGCATIGPEEDRVWVIRGGDAVVDARRIIEFETRRNYRMFEYGTRKVMARGVYRPGKPVEGMGPFKVMLEGRPEPGDRFWVEMRAGEALEYIVHQGMFLYPVSRFVEHALSNKDLKASYGDKAREYLNVIGSDVADKHERDWVDTSQSAGAYRFTPTTTERFPNRILPHNQYLALGRPFLVLQDASRKRLYGDRAARMARNFRKHLRKTGQAYTWHYWDWVEEGEPGHSGVEDTGHGHIDIGFSVEACRRGIVFTDADLKRFAHTLLDQMWNGSLEDPVIGGRVDTRDGNSVPLGDWMDLCQWDPKVWDVMWAVFEKAGRPAAGIPSVLQAWRRLEEGKSRRSRKK